MRKLYFLLGIVFIFTALCFAQEEKKALVLDDFEGEIIAGANGTIDAGSGNGSSAEVSADKAIKKNGEQSLKISYDAVSGGYIWVARGYGLDVKGAAKWLVEPEKIDFSRYGAISFYMYGAATGARIVFDIKDAGGEIFRIMVTDDAKDWKQVVCSFADFFPRGDWQPPTASVNGKLDFPVKSFQFEPIAIAKGSINIDDVELEALN